MAIAVVFLIFASVAALGTLYLSRPKQIRSHFTPAWNEKDLPLLILIDERGNRAEMIAKEAAMAWNEASKRRFFVLGGYEPNIEAFARPTPGIVTVRFLAGITDRPHAQLFLSRENRLRASPIMLPVEASDPLLLQILTHELGHALGLGHNSDKTSVMFARPIPGAQRITLSDLRALARLYPT